MKAQIQHCVSQLKRFAPCIQTHPLRSGRLQELLNETTFPKIWWNPIETLLQEGNYSNISKHADSLKNLIGVSYDDAVIVKGC